MRVRRCLIAVQVGGLLAVGLWFRVWRLDNLPGINGDEAWYGIQALKLLRGQSDTWLTPSHIPLNPFYLGIVATLHVVCEPSFLLLRIPAVVSGALALVVNFALCRQVFGVRLAWISTTLLSVSPTCIAYSRFGWDASQSLLFTTPVIYCCLASLTSRRALLWLAMAVVFQILACWVHPTNIFLSPMVLAAAAELTVRHYSQSQQAQAARRWRNGYSFFVAITCLSCVAAGTADVAALAEYPIRVLRLLSGVTVYRYLSGATLPGAMRIGLWDGPGYDAISAALLAGAFCLGSVASWYSSRRDTTRVLLTGLLLGLSLFYRIAGNLGVAPGYERYAIWLLGPTAVMISLGVDALLSRHIRGVVAVSLLGAWLLLAGFFANYFVYILRTGGAAHACFRTSEVEPKRAAVELIQRDSEGVDAIVIVAEDWWTYQPIRYLTFLRPNIEVCSSPADAAKTHPKDARTFARWRVALVGGDGRAGGERTSVDPLGDGREHVLLDFGGRPVLAVVRESTSTDSP